MKTSGLVCLTLLAFGALPALAQKQGQARLDSLILAVRAMDDDTGKVVLLNKVSMLCSTIDPRQGMGYGTQALRLAVKLAWKPGTAEAYNSIGCNYQSESIIDTSEHYFELALALNSRIGNRAGMARNLGNMGIDFYQQSNYPKSLDYFFQALTIFESLEDKGGIVTQLGNIGTIYYEQGDLRNALKYDTLALRKYLEIGDLEGTAIQLGNIGNIYDDLKDRNKAIAYDLEAIRICEQLGNKAGIARNLSNLSETYTAMGDAVKVLDCLQRALQLQEEANDHDGAAITCVNLGGFYLNRATDTTRGTVAELSSGKKNALGRGFFYLRKAISINESIGNLQLYSAAYRLLSGLHSAAGDYKSALAAYTSHRIFNDSVYSGENRIKISNLETRRALDLKDKQIELDRLAVAKKRNERGFFVAGIILLFGIIAIMFRNFRVQKRLNNLLSVEKKKVEIRTEALDLSNKELSNTLVNLRDAQQQLIVVEKQKENETIRSRISQDIHDDISSELTRISWVSELARSKINKSDYDGMTGLLEKITLSSRETVAKLGEIIWTVNPMNDSFASLLVYMRVHVERFFADTRFIYTISFPDAGTDIPINPELKRNLYLVMKEALNNVSKYSAATQVGIALELAGGRYRLCISDNGKGIEKDLVRGGGNGLRNMRQRMVSVQGLFELKSSPGNGTEICCSGPLL